MKIARWLVLMMLAGARIAGSMFVHAPGPEVVLTGADPAAVRSFLVAAMNEKSYSLQDSPPGQLHFSRQASLRKKVLALEPLRSVDVSFTIARIGDTTWVRGGAMEGATEVRRGLDRTADLGIERLLETMRDSLAGGASDSTPPSLAAAGLVIPLRGRVLRFHGTSGWLLGARTGLQYGTVGLVEIDPATGAAEPRCMLPTGTSLLAFSDGSAWVTRGKWQPGGKSRALWRLDLGSGAVSDSILLNLEPLDLLAHDGALWIADFKRGIVRLEPGTRSMKQIKLPGMSQQMQIAGGSLWCRGPGMFGRVDLGTLKWSTVLRDSGGSFPTGFGAMTSDGTSLYTVRWVEPQVPEIFRIDGRSGEVLARARVDQPCSGMKVHEGRLWIRHFGGLTCLDAGSLRTVAEWSDPYLPLGPLECVGNSVWLPMESHGRVVRLDIDRLLAGSKGR